VRVVQKPGSKGSLKWIQLLVNQRPELVEEELSALVGSRESVEWLSPLRKDQFAEYRDGSALKLLGVSDLRRPLRDFWPALGPQWDALARVGEALVLKGPADPREWEAATAVLHEALGIRGRKVPGMHHLYLDVGEIEAGPSG